MTFFSSGKAQKKGRLGFSPRAGGGIFALLLHIASKNMYIKDGGENFMASNVIILVNMLENLCGVEQKVEKFYYTQLAEENNPAKPEG
jgi:hypothetical protein